MKYLLLWSIPSIILFVPSLRLLMLQSYYNLYSYPVWHFLKLIDLHAADIDGLRGEPRKL
jgi:hypothetical protein